MARKKKILSEEDTRLWKKVATTIVPIAHRPKTAAKVPDGSIESVPVSRAKSPAADRPVAAKARKNSRPPDQRPPLKSPRQDFDHKTRRKIAKGRMAIEARIDLHGMSQSRASLALNSFIHACYMDGIRLVLVITGKGQAGTGILRRQVPNWLLSGELRPMVAACHEAHISHGGSGALYVRLKRRNQ